MTAGVAPPPPVTHPIVRDGTLAGVDPYALAAEFGTPLYVYDLDMVAANVRRVAAALPPMFDLAYAIKANPALGVVHHIGAMGAGADVSSVGELETALRARIPRERIVFTGPGKRDEELARAVEVGIRAITVESIGELERLERIAAAATHRVPVLLRANVADSAAEQRRIIGDGGIGKFGMPRDDLQRAAGRAAVSPHLELLGVHAFGASNVRDAATLAHGIGETVRLALDVTREAGVPLTLVDGGGGFGVAYADGEAPLDLDDLGRRLDALAREWAKEPALGDLRVIVEPGRALVAAAGAYLARVVDVKGDPTAPVVILDGGINHMLRPALIGQPHRAVAFPARSSRELATIPTTLSGPLCTGLDILGRDLPLPRLAPGDLVAILDAGAYGFTESMPLFLSHPTPAEVAINRGEARLLRPRITPLELLDRQSVPIW